MSKGRLHHKDAFKMPLREYTEYNNILLLIKLATCKHNQGEIMINKHKQLY